MGVKLNFLRAGRVVNLISDIVTSDLTFCVRVCALKIACVIRHTHGKMLNGLKMEKKNCNGYFLYECGDQTL